MVYSRSASYDGAGKLTSFAEAGTATISAASSTNKYDAAGNIRATISTHKTLDQNGTASSGDVTETFWFRYDAMNRLVTDKGSLVSGVIVRGATGQDIAYDAAGQRASAARTAVTPGQWINDWWGSYYIPGYYYEAREIYNYDGAGRVSKIRASAGTMVYEEYDYGTNTYVQPTYIPPAPAGATDGTQVSVFGYDLMGRQTSQTDYGYAGATVYSRSAVYAANGQLTSDNVSTVKYEQSGTNTYTSNTTYTYTASGQYQLGAVASTSAYNYKNGSFQNQSSTTNTYNWWNGPVQATIAHKPDVNQSATYTTTFYNDERGSLRLANILDPRGRRVFYAADTDGQVFRRDEQDNNTSNGDPHEIWNRFGRREWGYAGNNGTSKLSAVGSVTDRTTAGPTLEQKKNFPTRAVYGSSCRMKHEPIAPAAPLDGASSNQLAGELAPPGPRHDGWTAARQAAFLRRLGATHCVAEAARAVGMSRQSAYKLRNRLRGGPFDLAWQCAFQRQYDALAEVALERALKGVEVPHFHKGELIHVSRRFDERLTVALLALRERIAPPMRQPLPENEIETDDFESLIARVKYGEPRWPYTGPDKDRSR